MGEFEERLREWHERLRAGTHDTTAGRALVTLLRARFLQLTADQRIRARALLLKMGRPFQPD